MRNVVALVLPPACCFRTDMGSMLWDGKYSGLFSAVVRGIHVQGTKRKASHVYVCTYIYIYVYIRSARVNMFMYVYDMHAYVRMYVCMHACIHACIWRACTDVYVFQEHVG